MGKPLFEQPEQHRRGHARLRLGIAAELMTLDGRKRVTLLDLSQSGARVRLNEPGRLRQAMLYWIEFEAFGLVVWQDGLQVGLEFEPPISEATVLATRSWQPSEHVRQVRAEQRQFARNWATGRV